MKQDFKQTEVITQGYPLAVFGSFLLMLAFFLFFQPGLELFTFILGIVGLIFVTSHDSLVIDYRNKRVKLKTSALFIGYGKWTPLSEFDLIELTSIHESKRIESPWTKVGFNLGEHNWKLYLRNSENGHNKLLLRIYKTSKEADKGLQIYSKRLNLTAVDMTKTYYGT